MDLFDYAKARMLAGSVDISKVFDQGGVGYISRATLVELELVIEDGTPGSMFAGECSKPVLVEGETYTVITDSGEFQAVCGSFVLDEDLPFLYIGNSGIFGSIDTGEPFFYGEASLVGASMALDTDYGTKMIIEGLEVNCIDPKFLPEGGSGYCEHAVLTYDGDDTDKVMIDHLVKVSNTPMDLHTVTKLEFTLFDDDGMSTTHEIGQDEIRIEDADGYQFATAIYDGIEMAALMSIPSTDDPLEIGTYVASLKPQGWVTRAEFSIVHTIDPKFLPIDTESLVTEEFVDQRIIEATESLVTKAYVDQLIIGAIGGSY